MAIIAISGHRGLVVGSRAALALAVILLGGTGSWFAASWIDTGSDATCGAVIHPDIWLDDTAPDRCQGVMALRGAISAATIVTAGTLASFAARRRPLHTALAVSILTVVATASSAMLIINEAVRSDGAP
jgi:hypothetical protein